MTTPETQPLSKEQIAWLIRTLWTSLQAPGWTSKNHRDLEKLGGALLSGKSLKELDDSLYNRIFPHLVKIAESLGSALRRGPDEARDQTEKLAAPPSSETSAQTKDSEDPDLLPTNVTPLQPQTPGEPDDVSRR